MTLYNLLIDSKTIAPQLLVVLAGILSLAAFVFPVRWRKVYLLIANLVPLAAAICISWERLSAIPGRAFSSLLILDGLANYLNLFFLVLLAGVVILSMTYLRRGEEMAGEYFSLLDFAALGLMVMTSGLNLMVIFVGLELTSLALYALCAYRRDDRLAIESSVKYFLLGSYASGFFLMGLALVFGACGTVSIDRMLGLLVDGRQTLLVAGLALLLIGLLFKLAAVPFHLWVPDVYQGAPTPVVAFMSVGPKVAVVAILLRLLPIASVASDRSLTVFWVLTVLTMTVANLVALRQDDVKRMLAYSSIAHAGYLMVGLTAYLGSYYGSDVSPEGMHITSLLYYLTVYLFMNLGAFGLIMLWEEGGLGRKLKDIKGLAVGQPLQAGLMAVILFSLAGIPPLAGFMGKFLVFGATVKTGLIYLAVIGVLNSVIAAFYYLRVLVMMYMHTDAPKKQALVSGWALAVVIVCVFLIFLVGILPGKLQVLVSYAGGLIG